MGQRFYIFLISVPILLQAQGTWTQKADFAADEGRPHMAGFCIGTKCYAGTGGDEAWGANQYEDFWEWDSNSNVWTQKPNFPGGKRMAAVGFTIGQKGYLCSGTSADHGPYNDLWEYDPNTFIWTQRDTIPHSRESWCSAFVIGTKVYIHFPDQQIWEWDQGTGYWTRRADFPAGWRKNNISFAIGTKGYIGGGDTQVSHESDFWEYDPLLDLWTQKGSLPYPLSTSNPSNFAAVGSGYAIMCCSGQAFSYHPNSDSWSVINSFPGMMPGLAYSNGQKCYLHGAWGIDDHQFWEYSLSETMSIQKSHLAGALDVYPMPAEDRVTIRYSRFEQTSFTVTIKDILGEIIYTETVIGEGDYSKQFDLSLNPPGVYIVDILCGTDRIIRKFVLK